MLRMGWTILLALLLAAPAWAQPGRGVDGPAAPGLNRTFAVGQRWAMYGAPQPTRLDRAGFEALVNEIRNTRFDTSVTQVVVIVRDSDVDGTIGLVERRGIKATGWFVEEDGSFSVYDLWHAVGYQTTPEQIMTDHLENILAAEELYPDLPLILTAQVKRVARDAKGDLFVEFMVGNRYPEAALACYPWAGAPQRIDLRTLKSGDRLKASGQFTEFSNGSLKLRGCLFSR